MKRLLVFLGLVLFAGVVVAQQDSPKVVQSAPRASEVPDVERKEPLQPNGKRFSQLLSGAFPPTSLPPLLPVATLMLECRRRTSDS